MESRLCHLRKHFLSFFPFDLISSICSLSRLFPQLWTVCHSVVKSFLSFILKLLQTLISSTLNTQLKPLKLNTNFCLYSFENFLCGISYALRNSVIFSQVFRRSFKLFWFFFTWWKLKLDTKVISDATFKFLKLKLEFFYISKKAKRPGH